MIELLSRLLIKNREQTTHPAVRQAYGMLCGIVGICFNILLFTMKFFVGSVSNSIAITADAFNNLSDAGSSIITLIGFKMAGQKPDPDHPFGHGRIEYISGLFVAMIIILMAVELLKSSFSKILHPEEMIFSPYVIIILAISIVIKLYMYFYNRKVSKAIDSTSLHATAMDSFSDSLATAVVLLATLVSHFTNLAIDGYCGLCVGIFILYAGYSAAKDTISPLLGQAPNPAFVKQIQDIVLSQEGIIGIHDLIVHNYGPGRIIISLHAEVPADGDVLTMHDRIDLIEHKLKNALQCNAVIHMDPVCVNDPETVRYKELVCNIIQEIDSSISIHDFRIVKGPTHTNLIFDVAVPYRFIMSDDELIHTITSKIQEYDNTLYTVIEVDKLTHSQI